MSSTFRVRSSEFLLALTAAAASLALYVATLLRDFGGPEDTPKFQFVGYVLGTPHPPGYPLYVMLSHLFVQIPVGTIAYRANLFSAVLAALACALTYVLARQIGAARWAAFAGALALATGASYWRSAVFAEVYSLAAVTTALTISLLLAWGVRGTRAWLIAAVSVFALGLGNHLMSIGLLPACVLYTLLKNRRAVTMRLVGVCALIMAAGLAQYGFIILRSHQNAPYLESRALSFRELISVVTAERFAGQRFAFSPSELITIQAPVVASVLRAEMTIAGVALVIAGLVAAVTRRSSGAALVAGAAAGLLGMVLNLSGDLKGFITPVMVLLWPLAALGAAAAIERVRSIQALPPVAAATGLVVVAAIPVLNLAANYRDNDQSTRDSPAPFLRSMFTQLPDRAGIVAEDYWFDMAVHYMMLTGEAGPRRDIVRVAYDPAEIRQAARDGRRVFAFGGAATFLASQGLWFERTPIDGPPLEQWLGLLPKGTMIAGSTAYVAVPFDVATVGQPNARPAGRAKSFEAFALVARGAGSAWRNADDAVSLAVDARSLSGGHLPSPGALVAAADQQGARVVLDARTIAGPVRGLVLATFAPDGSLSRALEFPDGEPRRVPYDAAVYELKGESSCRDVAGGHWTDLTDIAGTGSWATTFPNAGQVVMEVELSPGVSVDADELLNGGLVRTSPKPSAGSGFVTSIELTRPGDRRPAFRVKLDRVPASARARVVSGSPSTLSICAFHPARRLFEDDSSRATVSADFESEGYFGAGWSAAQRDSGVQHGFRAAAGLRVRHFSRRATLFLPLERGYRYRIVFELAGAPGRVAFTIGEASVGVCELDGPSRCELTLEPGVLPQGITALGMTSTSEVAFHRARIIREPVRPTPSH